MDTKKIFRELNSVVEGYKLTITKTLTNYRAECEEAIKEAKVYKDERGYVRQVKTELSAKAKQEIENADEALSFHIKNECIPKLRDCLAEYITDRPDKNLMDTLNTYRNFGLKMSRSEVQAFLPLLFGNCTAMRALAAVAKDSGLEVSVPSIDDFQKDLDTLEKLARVPVQWTSMDTVSQAKELFGPTPVFGADGKNHVTGKGEPDFAHLVMVSSSFDCIDNMAERWGANFIPEVSEIEPEVFENVVLATSEELRAEAVQSGADGVKVTESDGDVNFAHELGGRRAEQAAATLDHFTQ